MFLFHNPIFKHIKEGQKASNVTRGDKDVIFCRERLPKKGIKEKILEAGAKADRPIYPREIAFIIKEKKNTVRVYCRRLLKKELIRQPIPHMYSAVTKAACGGAGVGERPPRLQNFVVQFGCVVPHGVPSFEGFFGSVGLKVLFGCRHQRVTGYFSCPEGMDFNTFVLALEKFKHVVASKLGVFPSNDALVPLRAEFLEDFQNVRMDFVKCLTVRSFLGSFEKLYNKSNGLRSEVRVQPDSVEAIYTLLKGGVTNYNVVQLVFLTLRNLEKLVEAVKLESQGVQGLQRMIFDFLERWDKRNEIKSSRTCGRSLKS